MQTIAMNFASLILLQLKTAGSFELLSLIVFVPLLLLSKKECLEVEVISRTRFVFIFRQCVRTSLRHIFNKEMTRNLNDLKISRYCLFFVKIRRPDSGILGRLEFRAMVYFIA